MLKPDTTKALKELLTVGKQGKVYRLFSGKSRDGQACRLVLNLGRTDATREQAEAPLGRGPIADRPERIVAGFPSAAGAVWQNAMQARGAAIFSIVAARDTRPRADVPDHIGGLMPELARTSMIRLAHARALLPGERGAAKKTFRAASGDALGSAAA